MRAYIRVASSMARNTMMLPRVELRKSLRVAVTRNWYAIGDYMVQLVAWVRAAMISFPLVARPFKIYW